MPIARLCTSTACAQKLAKCDDLIELWQTHSGIPSQNMTVQWHPIGGQHGVEYEIIAELCLPTLWESEQQIRLAKGLVKALMDALAVPSQQILVMVRPVPSGLVIDHGEVLTWPESTSPQPA